MINDAFLAGLALVLYGALVWGLLSSGVSWVVAALSSAVFVFVVHYLQIYVPGRSAEISDVVLTLIAGALAKIMPEN